MNQRKLWPCLLFLAIHLGAGPVLSANQDSATGIKITTQINKTSLKVGDTLCLAIKMVWQGEQDRFLIEQILSPQLENLHLLGTKTELGFSRAEETGQVNKEYLLHFTSDSVGPARIGALKVNYYDTRADQSGSFTSLPYEIKVMPRPRPGSSRFLWFLAAVGGLLGVGYLFRIYHKITKPSEKKAVTQTLEQQAKLRILVLDTGNPEIFLIQSRKIVINYLEQKVGQDLARKTTAEIVTYLNSFTSERKELVREILEQYDRARFIPGPAGDISVTEIVTKLEKLWEPRTKELVK